VVKSRGGGDDVLDIVGPYRNVDLLRVEKMLCDSSCKKKKLDFCTGYCRLNSYLGLSAKRGEFGSSDLLQGCRFKKTNEPPNGN
jgi:hypothetical protein